MTTVPAGLAMALLDRYRLDRELGQGGMATVYLAHDLKHARDVALKVLRPELAAILGRERFLAEIRLTAKLDHPHILTLIDSGETSGFLWYVLPYVRGESLRRKLERERQLAVHEAIAIACDIAGALDYAHSHGVVHRDVKPENILLHEGEAMLTDFGIALAVSEAGGQRLTETGLSVGTPQYMSPEQATADRQLDARSDIYSLGTVVYEMLAGEPPVTGASAQAVIAKLMTERPTSLRTLRDSIPESVDGAVARALAKVPADRFPSAAEFAAALRDSRSPKILPKARRPVWRVRALMVLGLVAALTFAGRLILAGGHKDRRAVRSPELLALYQRALHDYGRRTSAGAGDAIRGFSELVRRDSAYAEAWTGLAKSYTQAYGRSFTVPGVPRDSVLKLALAAVERALALDPLSADAWVAHSGVTRLIDPTDRRPVFRSLRRALALDSASGPAWNNLAMSLAETGDFREAIAAWRRSVAVAPAYAEGVAFRAYADYWRRQYDSAAAWADSAIALDPGALLARQIAAHVAVERGEFVRAAAAFEAARRLSGDVEVVNALAGSALAEARAGRRAAARSILQRAESLATAYTPTPMHTALYLAAAYAALNDANRALGWLTRYEPRGDLHFQLHLRCDPPLAPIAGDPRFRALLSPPAARSEDGC